MEEKVIWHNRDRGIEPTGSFIAAVHEMIIDAGGGGDGEICVVAVPAPGARAEEGSLPGIYSMIWPMLVDLEEGAISSERAITSSVQGWFATCDSSVEGLSAVQESTPLNPDLLTKGHTRRQLGPKTPNAAERDNRKAMGVVNAIFPSAKRSHCEYL